MILHATTDDLAAEPWQVTADNAPLLLRYASRLIDTATLTAVYDTDDDGRPTDPGVLAALRDATCAQAAVWAALGIDPLKGAADAGKSVASKGIGGASIQYAVYASTAEARATAATALCAEAWQILTDAYLTPGQVYLLG